MINGMILDAMAGEGLEPVDTSGVFDPRYHEAVGEIDNNQKPDQHVFDELRLLAWRATDLPRNGAHFAQSERYHRTTSGRGGKLTREAKFGNERV